MPQLASPPTSATSLNGRKKKKPEKVALVFSSENIIEQRRRPSQYAEFFEGTSVGEYFYKRMKERKLLEKLESEEDRLTEEDPEQLQELYDLLGAVRTLQLPPYKSIKYHQDLIEEASTTVLIERQVPEDDDQGEYFVLSEEDRLRLERMFAEMSGEKGELEHNCDDDTEDEDCYSDTGSTSHEAEADNGKPRGHFSRWERNPVRQPAAAVDKKEQKFKPRLNVVWQKRLENSKIDREKKDELQVMPADPKNALFNSIIPKKYRRKPKSRLPSIVVSNTKKDKIEPVANVEISKPRQNRSSELRMQKRLLQEAGAKGTKQRKSKAGDNQRRLKRSQSQTGVSKSRAGSMRRSASMRTLPTSQDEDAMEPSLDRAQGSGQKRKGTPHPGRRSQQDEEEGLDQKDDHEDAESRVQSAVKDSVSKSINLDKDDDEGIPPVSM